MTRSELEAFLIEELEGEDREETLQTQEVLSILGLIPDGMDLYQLVLDLHTELVLGLFDDETEMMYVVGDLEALGPTEETTFAHEYVHALQQQHFDIHALHETVEEDSEAHAALSALIEGDAYLLTFQYMVDFLSARELAEALDGGEESPIFDQAPYAVRQLFLFSPLEGIAFVRSLLAEGGLDAVNNAFSNPPVSTEQVLHPEKYRLDERPAPVTLPDIAGALGVGWSQIDTDVLGEYFLRTYLETGIAQGAAAAAAAGWGGDRYVLLRGPQDQRAFLALTAWDTEEDARQFFEVALAPLRGISHQSYADIHEDQVLLIIAPSQGLIDALRAQLPGF